MGQHNPWLSHHILEELDFYEYEQYKEMTLNKLKAEQEAQDRLNRQMSR
jgi:hypothetical protein